VFRQFLKVHRIFFKLSAKLHVAFIFGRVIRIYFIAFLPPRHGIANDVVSQPKEIFFPILTTGWNDNSILRSQGGYIRHFGSGNKIVEITEVTANHQTYSK
jgi:hypothetical protein